MTVISLAPPNLADTEALLAFETANRAFFEQAVNARPPGYYSAQGVRDAIEAAIADAAHDRAYQFLVRSGAGAIVGRVNLSGVRRAHFDSAVLGYRIGAAACGKGHASGAVGKVIAIAFAELGLLRLEADCRPENIGLVRVLQRNGFVQYGRSTRSFELGGVWYDRLHFERHAHGGDAR